MQNINSFINAKLVGVRLLRESCKTDEHVIRPGMNLQMIDQTTIEVRLESVPDAGYVLAVIHHMHAIFANEQKVEVITYEATHDVRFEVTAYTGFEPTEALPNEAVTPYIEMSSWLARGRALNTVRSMGLANFVWPISAAVARGEEVASETKA